jgi:hypothetical protein
LCARRRNRRRFVRARALHRRRNRSPQFVGQIQLCDDRRNLRLADVTQLSIREARVERAREPRQIIGCDVARQLEEALRADAERGHDDRDAGARSERDQLHVLEDLRLGLRLRDECEIVRKAPEQSRCLIDQVIELAARVAQFLADARAIRNGKRLGLHKLIDVRAVACVGGDTTGRRMRLHEVAAGLQLRHLVPHGCGADAEVVLLRERLRSDGLRGRHVLVDDRREDVRLALVEVGALHCSLY